ncbi:MAG: glucose-6-phosphate dehydrogenase [Desulfarculaceae bacterium]|nr:glucose-6-phosphate dehydrogenase [Desulfarculaceae bacterium]
MTPPADSLFALDGLGCQWPRPADPCALVIFGASGDLAGRKLLPALYDLYLNQGLPERFAVVGAARSELSDEAFRERALAGAKAAGMDLERWDDFAAGLFYQPVEYAEAASFAQLAGRLDRIDLERGLAPGSRVFNLAVPPSLYGTVAQNLGAAGLSRQDLSIGRWSRLVVEKPFGYDLASARELGRVIAASFDESQVFRIDHYMAKETVQNILVLRFANAIFEPLWNRNFIDYVRINASESLGVEHRAGYYEGAGVLRDMFQNHMMQLLALVAAEPPSRFDAERVRDKEAELFRCLRPFPSSGLGEHLVLGQYASGESGGERVRGYRSEPGVDPESTTPTYAAMRLWVDNWRWQGVPFYLTSGKRLKRKVTRIDIQFKEVPHSLFRDSAGADVMANRLVIGIHPEEEIFIAFQAKQPGPRICLRTSGLHFNYSGPGDRPHLDAYAKSLADAMAGDQTLFWRQDGLELCWNFMEPVLSGCEVCADVPGQLHMYPAGSYGPDAALDMLPQGIWPEKPS